MDRNTGYFLLFIAFSFLINISYAQLGEVAGSLNFNVNLSSSESLQLIVINSGSTPLVFNVLPLALTPIVNTTTPILTVSPTSGTIQPYAEQIINVTVYMPGSKNVPGLHWSGFLQVVQGSNQTNPGGAVIQTGVAKRISITSTSPKPGIPLLYITIAAVVIVAAGGIYYFRSRRATAPAHRISPKRAVASSSRKATRAARAKGRGKNAKLAKKKTTAKKRAGKKATRQTKKRRRTR